MGRLFTEQDVIAVIDAYALSYDVKCTTASDELAQDARLADSLRNGKTITLARAWKVLRKARDGWNHSFPMPEILEHLDG